MPAIVKTHAYWLDLVTQIIDATTPAASLLSAAKLGLGTAAITPNVNTVFGDVVECDFVGYAQSATVVWGLPTNETDGTLTTQSPSHLFRATANTTPNSVANFFVTDGVASPGTGILASGSIFPAIPIINSGDGFSLVVSWNEGAATVNSEGTVIS